MSKTEKQYRLTLSETQVNVLQQALDMYFRVGMGQTTEVVEHIIPPIKDMEEWCKRRDAVTAKMREAKMLAMPDLHDHHSYYGIYAPEIDESNRVACDVHDVIRYVMAWERFPKGGFGVAWDRPAHKSAEPLPLMERVESAK